MKNYKNCTVTLNYWPNVFDMARVCVDCCPNCGGCFVWALENKVCLWKMPQQRGNSEWCNMFFSTLSGKSKDPRQYTNTCTPPCRSTFYCFSFSLLNTHTHTISGVYDTRNYNIHVQLPQLLHLFTGMWTWKDPWKRTTKHTATAATAWT